MDYQNRAGNKGAGVAGASEANVDRRERLRKLALETIDIAKDPYILRNHLGSLECRLCLTLHTNEGSYLAHTQGKKHQTNLARRAAREAKLSNSFADAQRLLTGSTNESQKKHFLSIGSPGFKITKIREPLSSLSIDGKDASGENGGSGGRVGMLFQIQLPKIKEDVKPMHRFMSTFEQHVEPQNRAWQYLVVAAEPYSSIAFKLQARSIDRSEGIALSTAFEIRAKEEPVTWSFWDPDVKTYTIQVMFK